MSFLTPNFDFNSSTQFCNSCQIKVIPAFLLFNGRNFIDRKKGNNIPGVVEMINSRLFPPVNFEVLNQNNPVIKQPYQQQKQPYQQADIKKDPYEENKKIFNKEKLFL